MSNKSLCWIPFWSTTFGTFCSVLWQRGLSLGVPIWGRSYVELSLLLTTHDCLSIVCWVDVLGYFAILKDVGPFIRCDDWCTTARDCFLEDRWWLCSSQQNSASVCELRFLSIWIGRLCILGPAPGCLREDSLLRGPKTMRLMVQMSSPSKSGCICHQRFIW